MYNKLMSLNNNVMCYCKIPYEKFVIINKEFAEMFTLVKESSQKITQIKFLKWGLGISIFVNIVLLLVTLYEMG